MAGRERERVGRRKIPFRDPNRTMSSKSWLDLHGFDFERCIESLVPTVYEGLYCIRCRHMSTGCIRLTIILRDFQSKHTEKTEIAKPRTVTAERLQSKINSPRVEHGKVWDKWGSNRNV